MSEWRKAMILWRDSSLAINNSTVAKKFFGWFGTRFVGPHENVFWLSKLRWIVRILIPLLWNIFLISSFKSFVLCGVILSLTMFCWAYQVHLPFDQPSRRTAPTASRPQPCRADLTPRPLETTFMDASTEKAEKADKADPSQKN